MTELLLFRNQFINKRITSSCVEKSKRKNKTQNNVTHNHTITTFEKYAKIYVFGLITHVDCLFWGTGADLFRACHHFIKRLRPRQLRFLKRPEHFLQTNILSLRYACVLCFVLMNVLFFAGKFCDDTHTHTTQCVF